LFGFDKKKEDECGVDKIKLALPSSMGRRA